MSSGQKKKNILASELMPKETVTPLFSPLDEFSPDY
jgi:hypothetical protein